jgi:hypothetical protein
MLTLPVTPSQGKCSMRPTHLLMIAATIFILSSHSAFSETTISFDPLLMRECPQADGSSLYTNKDLPGCTLMTLKELSIVPSLDDMPTYRPAVTTAPHSDRPAYPDRHQAGMTSERQTAPDWAKDWHASIASSESVHAEVCSMYGEWIHLVQKTRGGVFFGSDPSYGGDPSGRNQRGASYPFYDNTRYVALARIFGPGFVPIGCP